MNAYDLRRIEVHETLLPVLAEFYGDQVRVSRTDDAAGGAVEYALPYSPFVGSVCVTALNDRAAAVLVRVRLGRCYKGYRQALRWLTCNRAGNTVAVSVREEDQTARELCVASHRVTFPGDAAGIGAQLVDVQVEGKRLLAGLAWFPQLAWGERIGQLETAGDEAATAMLAAPWGFVQWVGENRAEALQNWGTLPAEVCGWVGCWPESLALMDDHYRALTAAEQRDVRAGYLLERLKLLRALQRFAEMLPVVDELTAAGADFGAKVMWERLCALCELGRAEEASELAKSAAHDEDPQVWYWRSIAAALQQRFRESLELYATYESRIGPDLFGRQKLRELFPPNWAADNGLAAD